MEDTRALCLPPWFIQGDDHMLLMHFPCKQGMLKLIPFLSLICASLAASVDCYCLC